MSTRGHVSTDLFPDQKSALKVLAKENKLPLAKYLRLLALDAISKRYIFKKVFVQAEN